MCMACIGIFPTDLNHRSHVFGLRMLHIVICLVTKTIKLSQVVMQLTGKF